MSAVAETPLLHAVAHRRVATAGRRRERWEPSASAAPSSTDDGPIVFDRDRYLAVIGKLGLRK